MKDERLFIKIAKADKDDINTYAKSSAHKNASKLIRTFLKEYILSEKYQNRHYDELQALRKEVNAIGNNINQIAKHLNAGQSTELTILDEWKATRNKLDKALNRIRPFKSS